MEVGRYDRFAVVRAKSEIVLGRWGEVHTFGAWVELCWGLVMMVMHCIRYLDW